MGLLSFFSKFEQTENSDWEFYLTKRPTKRTELYLAELRKSRYGKSGKYLFYSKNRNLLLKLGKRLLITFELPEFKVSKKYRNDEPRSMEFVLCVYDSAPDFLSIMKKYGTNGVFCFGWKSNSQTLADFEAKYSEKYLGRLIDVKI